MKQNIIYPIFLMLFAIVSCTQQENENVIVPVEEVTVTFSVSPEQTFGTRANANTIGQGSNINRLVCAVYDVEGNLLRRLGNNDNGQIVMDGITFSASVSVPLRLVRGQEYKVVFWAQDRECQAYRTDDLSKVVIDYNEMQCNDDKCDAFCKAEVFTASADETKAVVLRRPFAQLNIGMTKDEFATLDFDISKSQITLGPVAAILNVVENSVNPVDGSIEQVTFVSAPVPDESFFVETVGDEGTTTAEYKYIAMCYFLVADKNDGTSTYSSAIDGMTLPLFDKDGNENRTFATQEKIPVQRNWSTNIVISKESLVATQ